MPLLRPTGIFQRLFTFKFYIGGQLFETRPTLYMMPQRLIHWSEMYSCVDAALIFTSPTATIDVIITVNDIKMQSTLLDSLSGSYYFTII